MDDDKIDDIYDYFMESETDDLAERSEFAVFSSALSKIPKP